MSNHPGLDQFPKAPADSRFYVILSGLIPLIEYVDDNGERKLRAYMLFMKGHGHLAGQWLAEQEVPLGSVLSLYGVNAGNRSLRDGTDGTPLFSIDAADVPQIDDPSVHAIIELPLPRNIYFLNRGETSIQDLAHPERLIEKPQYLAGTKVLEYTLQRDFPDVVLAGKSGFTWRNGNRRTTFDNGTAIGTLHLLDGIADLAQVPLGHNAFEYKANAQLFKTSFGFAAPLNEVKNELPDGLSEWELLPLDWRAVSMDYLADYFRTGKLDLTKGVVSGLCKPCCAACAAIVKS